MSIDIPAQAFFGFLFALARTSAWMAIAPPFNTRLIPRLVKIGVAAALAVPMASQLPVDNMSMDTAPFVGQIVLQVFTGLALGFVTMMLFSAFQAAGELIDLAGGFSIMQVFDPYSNDRTSAFGRFYQLIATTILFVLNGHLLLVRGFMRSFEAVPPSGPSFDNLAQLLVRDVGVFMLAALEIAAPLLAALFLAEVALGILAKAAPQMNVFMLGFPFKILLTLLIVVFAVPLLPNAVGNIVERALDSGAALMRGG